SEHGYFFRVLDHGGQDLVERPRALHMAAGFGTLADEVVGADVEGTPRASGAADLNAHLRTRIPNGRDSFLCRNAPRELNDWRPSIERDLEGNGINREQVVHRDGVAGAGFGLRHALS